MAGRTGGYALSFDGDSIDIYVESSKFYVVGFAFKYADLTNPIVVVALALGGSLKAGLSFNPTTGRITMDSGSATYTDTTALDEDTWYYIELRCDFENQSVTFRINEDNFVGVSGSTIPTDSVDRLIFFGSNVSGEVVVYDDIYALDGTGEQNNDALGIMCVEGIRPAGVGSSSQWSTSDTDRANFEAVAWPGGNFLYSDTVGQTDSYLFSPLRRITQGPIYGVSVGIEGRNSGTQSHGIAAQVKTGATASVSDTVNLESSNPIWVDVVYEQNPNTQVNWNTTDFATSEFGVKLTTPLLD